jgi:hypothetical protein
LAVTVSVEGVVPEEAEAVSQAALETGVTASGEPLLVTLTVCEPAALKVSVEGAAVRTGVGTVKVTAMETVGESVMVPE